MQARDMRLERKLETIGRIKGKIGDARVESMKRGDHEDWLFFALLFLLEDMERRVKKKLRRVTIP